MNNLKLLPMPENYESSEEKSTHSHVKDPDRKEANRAVDTASLKKEIRKLKQSLKSPELASVAQRISELKKLNKLDSLDNLERLSALDELKRLEALTELARLEKLDKLKDLENLADLGHLKELSKLERLDSLEELASLKELENLSQLEKLSGLERLEELKTLDRLDELKNLDRINELSSLERLEELNRLDKIQELSKLDSLENLKRLDELSSLEELERLSALESLSQLENLEKISNLKELQKLDWLQSLGELERLEGLGKLDKISELKRLDLLENLEKLQELEKLEKLSEFALAVENLKHLMPTPELKEILNSHTDLLARLDRLENLEHLKNLDLLENLEDLNKLEGLQNLRILESKDALKAVEKINNLPLIKDNWKSYLAKSFFNTFFDFVKIVGLAIGFFLFSQSHFGQQSISVAMSAAGFEDSSKANFALALLSDTQDPQSFQKTFENAKARADREIREYFSLNPRELTNPTVLKRLDHLSGYDFKRGNLDLKAHVEAQMSNAYEKELDRFKEVYEYEALKRVYSQKQRQKMIQIESLLKRGLFSEAIKSAASMKGQGFQSLKHALRASVFALHGTDRKALEETLSKVDLEAKKR